MTLKRFPSVFVFFTSLIICNQLLCFAKESHCYSRYDYEEKLLERVIRTDLQMQQAIEKLDTTMEKVDTYRNEFGDFKRKHKRSLEEELAVIKNHVSLLEAQIAQFKGTLKSPVVAFNMKGVTDKSPIQGQVIVFNDVILNTGGAFDVQTGVFVAPVNATYMFGVQVCSSFRQHASFKLVADDVTLLCISNYNYASGLTSASGSVVHSMRVGGKVWVQNEYDAGTSSNLEDSDTERACWNQFTGALIGVDGDSS